MKPASLVSLKRKMNATCDEPPDIAGKAAELFDRFEVETKKRSAVITVEFIKQSCSRDCEKYVPNYPYDEKDRIRTDSRRYIQIILINKKEGVFEMSKKIKIEKNTVQETLVMPLYAKAWAVKTYPDLFHDADCHEIMERLDYDFSTMQAQEGSVKMRLAALAAAVRQYALVCEIKEYLKEHPKALVVNIGCGLDTAGHQADNGECRFANIDFPNVIELRKQLLPSTDREENIASDLNDRTWFEKIGFDKEDGAIFIASGVFLYFKKDDVKKLFIAMAERFPGARLAFDGQNTRGMKIDLKAIRASGIDVSANFALDDPVNELKSWSEKFENVESKKMFTDYLKPDRRFGLLYRILTLFSDRNGMSQLDVIEFRKE